ncbi:MAG TPA: hypothetical protein VK196_12855 [Magnetospirillum sp.]|nr:hypothetical protein [Magnetospirillum sp.]
MRAHLILAAALVAMAQAAGATEAAPFDQATAVSPEDLGGSRGGTETPNISGSLLQSNDSNLSGTNNGSISVGGGSGKYSGLIAPAQVSGNNGITAVMQNTGDLVNMNNATSVNVYMR